jgi:hypothetical protein
MIKEAEADTGISPLARGALSDSVLRNATLPNTE